MSAGIVSGTLKGQSAEAEPGAQPLPSRSPALPPFVIISSVSLTYAWKNKSLGLIHRQVP